MPALLLLIIFVPAFWLLVIRPQQQRQQAHQEMVAALRVGDLVEGFSGIHGTLVALGDRTVQMEIAPGVVVTMAKLAVASKIDDTEDQVESTDNAAGSPAAPTEEDPA